MKHVRRSAAGLAVAAVTASLTGVGIAQATASAPAPASPSVHVGTRAVAENVVVHGSVIDPGGAALDNVSVEARSVTAPTVVVASAITYGGDYDLYVPVGKYLLTYSDLSEVYGTLIRPALNVAGNRTLDTVRMLFPAPRAVVAPSVKGAARAGNTLRAVPGKWDVEGVELAYEWKVNGVAVAAGSTFPLSAKHVGANVSLTVIANAKEHVAAVVSTRTVKVAKFASKVVVTDTKALKDRRVVLGVRVDTLGNLKDGKVIVSEVTGPERALVARFPAAATSGSLWKHSFVLPRTKKGVHTYVVEFKGTSKVEGSAVPAIVKVR